MKKPKGFGNAKPLPNSSEVSEKTVKKWLKLALKGDLQAQMNYTNYNRALYNKYSYMEGSTMIHERDYIPMNCCLCDKHMPSIHDTHNPQPLTPKCFAKEAQEKQKQGLLAYRCCQDCNNSVVADRRDKDIAKRGGRGVVPIFDFFQGEADCLKDRDYTVGLVKPEELEKMSSLSDAYKEDKDE